MRRKRKRRAAPPFVESAKGGARDTLGLHPGDAVGHLRRQGLGRVAILVLGGFEVLASEGGAW